MKNVILTGATGMVGSLILDECLNSEKVQQVTSIVRKPSGRHHIKLNEIVHADFRDFTLISESFKNQDIALYCLGVYTGAVPKDEFRKITVDFTEAFAKTLKANSKETTFCFLSGQGADQTEKSSMMFARDKGAAENILEKANFKSFHSFRPGYIYPSIPRDEPNTFYRIIKVLYKPIAFVYPNIGISSVDLANAMFKVGFSGHPKTILENKDIRMLAAHA